MDIRTAIAAAGIGLAAVTISAATASAVVPITAPGVIAGAGFSHPETVALSNSPVPSVLGIGLLAGVTAVHVDPNSSIPQQDGRVNADMATVFADAANSPNGKIVLALVDPAQWNGKFILVAEYL
ncbi:hypothetical protein [Nocardia sp. XZ_19_369]|uniref:hypothetical protein n=1 Tax=Nocardia sp. XZ_19_369 TaxID=2769487 RepID=UPI0018904BA3|nr:hypothetical protein [Nocardia sp. XZ_19_369]